MEFSRVIAIIRPEVINKVVEKLHSIEVPGINTTQVKAYDDYVNYYTEDWMVTHTRVEVLVAEMDAEEVAEAIMSAAHTGLEGDGIVSISPVSALYHIRTKEKCSSKPC